MKTPPFHQRSKASSGGFSLVEIVIALSVVAFAFLSIVGLMGVGLVSDQNSTQQTEATNIAASIISDLQSTQNVSGTSYSSPRYGILLSTTKVTTATQPAKPLTAAGTTYYFDDTGHYLGNTAASKTGAVFLARVVTAQVLTPTSASNTNGNPVFAARVIVAWPAAVASLVTTPLKAPTGTVELVTQFQLHSSN
jgi:uncharacterized protein (TIGR02598 family)